MKNALKVILMIFVVVCVVCVADCAEKTQTARNDIKGASEHVTPVFASTASQKITKTVAISASPVTIPTIDENRGKHLNPRATNKTQKDSERTTYSIKPAASSMDSGSSVVIDTVEPAAIDNMDPNSLVVTDTVEPAATDSMGSNSSKVMDVVCKLEIYKGSAEFTSEYNGEIYYFCSADCKQRFDKNPEEFIKAPLETPVAAFTASPTSGKAPLNVVFIDVSTGKPTSWNWNFGDGNTSIEQNPINLYSAAGNYTVNLTVTNENGTNSSFARIIVLKSKLLIANFRSNVTKGNAPLTVQFTDLSENATEWNWDFGNGKSSTAENPICIYSKIGKYNVTLTVKNLQGDNKVTKYRYISVNSSKVTDTVCKR